MANLDKQREDLEAQYYCKLEVLRKSIEARGEYKNVSTCYYNAQDALENGIIRATTEADLEYIDKVVYSSQKLSPSSKCQWVRLFTDYRSYVVQKPFTIMGFHSTDGWLGASSAILFVPSGLEIRYTSLGHCQVLFEDSLLDTEDD